MSKRKKKVITPNNSMPAFVDVAKWAYGLLGFWWLWLAVFTIGGLTLGLSSVVYVVILAVSAGVGWAYDPINKNEADRRWNKFKDHASKWWGNRPGNEHETHNTEGT